MKDQEILDELREIRKDVADLSKEFYVFKGKAFGFLTLLSAIFSLAFDYLFKHKS